MWFSKLRARLSQLTRRKITCVCGHKAHRKTILNLEDGSGVYSATENDYCPECWQKAIIRCAWCGKQILPGKPVTLNSPSDPAFVVPTHAVVYSKEPLRLVGCLRWDCGDGACRAGFWVMPGKVKRVLSPLEMVMMGGEEVQIVHDLSDQHEAIEIREQ